MKKSPRKETVAVSPSETAPNRPADWLIATKLSRPVALPGAIEREHLLSRLDDALNARVVLISAPAGFGKSTLAAQWFDRTGLDCAWVSLDPYDNDPEQFLRYLVAAIDRATGVLMEQTNALLTARETPPFDYVTEMFVSEVSQLSRPLFIAFDDYHGMGSSQVHELLERVVSLAPASLVLMVVTRRDPPWPIGRWNAQGWLVELRERDLRFSLEETRRFFAADAPALSDRTVELLHRRSEGWIAGLRLLKLSLDGAERPEERARAFSGRDRLVADYLVSEVLAKQPPEVRQFLAATALLPRFSAALGDHLLAEGAPRPAAREMLEKLESENLFLVRLDGEGSWYRYHHLFRDLLLHHLPELATGEAKAELLRRAAECFADQKLYEEALRLYLEAGDVDAAADLVGEQMRGVTEEDPSRRLLAHWLDMFPDGAEHGRPSLLVARGLVYITSWDLPGLAEVTEEAERLLRERRSGGSASAAHNLTVDLAAEKAFLYYWTGDVDAALEVARTALADLPPNSTGGTRTLALYYRAGSLRMLGRLQEAVIGLQEAVSEAFRADRPRVAELLFAEGIMYLYEADTDAAELVARRALTVLETTHVDDFWLGHVLYLAAAVAYEKNHLEEAAAGFRRMRELRFRTGTRPYHDALIGLSLIARARGDEEGAARHAADGRAFALQAKDPGSVRVADSFDARLQRAAGRSMASGPPPPSIDHTFFFIEVPSLTYAECLLRDPSLETRAAALPFIVQALERAEAAHNVRQALAFSLLRALALADRGEQEAALDELAATVRRAEGLGPVRTFVDRGPRLAELLEKLVLREDRTEYLETLLSAFHKEGTPPAKRDDAGSGQPWQGLTHREIDVLELLAERLTNKEIGERLFISPETVKRHTLSIYRKLGVSGRRHAVAKALADGIIAPPQRKQLD